MRNISLTIILFFIYNSLISQQYLGSYTIIHKSGNLHSIDFDTWKDDTKKNGTLYRNLSFDIKFDESCKYVLTDTCGETEQGRKQKVMKLTTSQDAEQMNSLRLGWYYDPNIDKIRLAFYAHINHTAGGSKEGKKGREYRTFDKKIDANQWVRIKMAIGKKGMYMSMDGEAIVISRDIDTWSSSGQTTYVRANSYFEYQRDYGYFGCFADGPPQDMKFYIQNAIVDDPAFPWGGEEYFCNTPQKLELMNTNFTDSSPSVYKAGTSIETPVLPISYQSQIQTDIPYEVPFTVVEPNADVTFIASNSITLKAGVVKNGYNFPTGFHAKAGSHFVARIENVPTGPPPINLITEPWDEYAEPYCFTIENATYASMYVYFYPDGSNETILYGPIYGEFYDNDICFDLPFYNNGNTSGVYAVHAIFTNDCYTLNRDIQYNYTASKGKSNNMSSSNSQNDKIVFVSDTVRKTGEANSVIDENPLIFPNPSSGLIHLELPKAQNKIYSIKVFNTLSLLVYNVSNITTNRYTIDLSNQPNGIYLVKITSGSEVYLRKVVIE